MTRKCMGHFLVGGADIDKERCTFGNMFGNQFRNFAFAAKIENLTVLVGCILGRGHACRAAVITRN